MNTWKEHAHLFGNGKFKVKAGNSDDYIEIFQPYINDSNGKYYHNGWGMYECTLIARPIAGMTNDELYNYMGAKRFVHRSALIKNATIAAEANTKNSIADLDLLSLGVYPFDQSHFDDGTILNINEVEL